MTYIEKLREGRYVYIVLGRECYFCLKAWWYYLTFQIIYITSIKIQLKNQFSDKNVQVSTGVWFILLRNWIVKGRVKTKIFREYCKAKNDF